jgi:hypothetical protein
VDAEDNLSELLRWREDKVDAEERLVNLGDGFDAR